jgi:MFS transporter, DHA1 family, multidrug resistance protein
MKLSRRRAVPPLWLLGLFTFSGPVGMHIFVPALPSAAKDLHATPAALELTVSLYIMRLEGQSPSVRPAKPGDF